MDTIKINFTPFQFLALHGAFYVIVVSTICPQLLFEILSKHASYITLLKYKGRKAQKLYPLTLFQDSNMMFTCLLVERQGKVELTDTNDVLA